MRALVIGVRRYDFKDDSGDRVRGLTLHYVMPEASSEEDTQGYLPLREGISLDLASQIPEVPGYYDLRHEMRPGRNSRPTPTLVSLTFEGPAEVGTIPPREKAS